MFKKILISFMSFLFVFSMAQITFAESEVAPNDIGNAFSNITEPVVPYGTTSKTVLVNTASGTKYNSANTRRIDYNIKTYKIYIKPEHSSTWHYDHTKYVWFFDGYKKSGSSWVYVTTKSGTDRVHGDPDSLMGFFIQGGF